MRYRYFSLTIICFVLFSANALAQLKTVGEPEVLLQKEGVNFQAPIWSPDGQTIAVTGERYVGIWLADSDGSNLRELSSDDAGFGMTWSSDSESILSRVNTYENRRRNHAITVFHKNGDEPVQITEPRSKMSSLPQWAQYGEKIVLIQEGRIEKFDSGKEVPQRFKNSPSQPFYILKDKAIATGMIPTNTTEDISPFDDAQYLNLEVSPDGQKIAFEVYAGNLYVMNVDGSNLIDLGLANRPNWSPDSKYVVASVSEDNGYNITKGDLYAFSTDGNERVNLTANTDLIAQNPNWSPSGDKIAFDSPDKGSIYIINIQQ